MQRHQLPGDLRWIGALARRLADPVRPETMPHGQPAAAFAVIYPVHSHMIPQASDESVTGSALACSHMPTQHPSSPGLGRRWARIVVLAVAFGMALAWLKGNGGGLRDAVGNVSAVWLLLPFLAGAAAGSRRLPAGAVAGLAATLAALVGFYVAESFVLDLGPHPWPTDLSLTMAAIRRYAEGALLTGPVFGALGFWWRQRRSLAAAGLLAAAFVFEPAAWWLYGQHIGGGAAYPVPGYPALWLTEVAVGVAGFALLAAVARRAPTPA